MTFTSIPVDIETPPKLVIRRILGDKAIELSNRDNWTLGRDEACDIVLQDTWISRQHAAINRTAEGEYYIEDLGSRNGSNVNGQTILQPTRLQNGDLIILGTTEIEFQHLDIVALEQQNRLGTLPKMVLITQMHAPQRDIWESLLASQGLEVQVDPSYPDLQNYLTNAQNNGHRLPELLIIDIETYPSNSYAFCRWCRTHLPNLKVLLISGKRTEIFPVERQWAVYQGAHDLMPGIQESNLMANALDTVAKVEQVFKALNLRPQQQRSIVTTLLELQESLANNSGVTS